MGKTRWRNVKRDMVLVVTSSTPSGHWPTSIVIGTYPGKGGFIRVAMVRMANRHLLTRPVHKLVPIYLQLLSGGDVIELAVLSAWHEHFLHDLGR